MREAHTQHIHWVSAGRIDIPQPQAVSSPTLPPTSGKCGNRAPETEEAASQIRARWRQPPESLNKPHVPVPPAQIASLYRYPVKGLSPEPLPRVALRIGETLPADRRYAIENGPSGFDPRAPAWMPKSHFLMLMRDERLAGLRSHFEDSSNLLTIRENGIVVARGDLESAEGRAAIEAFFATNFADELKGPPKVISGGGHSFPTSPGKSFPSSISQRRRRRSHCWPAGSSATVPRQSLRQRLAGMARIRAARPSPRHWRREVEVVKRITRCAAINVDPETGARNLDIPPTMMRRLRHNECGIYAEVIAGGTIGVGDAVATEAPKLL